MPKSVTFISDDDQFNESLLVHDVARLLRKNFDRRAHGLGLTRAQWFALAMLRRNPGIKQSELADLLEVEPITVARILDRLEAAGWVERKQAQEDRRIKRLFLTKRAQGIVGQMRELALETRGVALKGMSAEEHAALLSALKHMKTNLCKNKGCTA